MCSVREERKQAEGRLDFGDRTMFPDLPDLEDRKEQLRRFEQDTKKILKVGMDGMKEEILLGKSI